MTSPDTPDDDPLPLLPYAGTSGWAGSETSRERADRDDRSGATAARQALVLAALDRRGPRGGTWAEIGDELRLHHGQASGALSNLHQAGRISRLTERRGRSLVYVSNHWLEGRASSPPGRTSGSQMPTSIAPGTLPVILPTDIVEHISRGKTGEPMSIPREIADQIRAACLQAVAAIPEPRADEQ